MSATAPRSRATHRVKELAELRLDPPEPGRGHNRQRWPGGVGNGPRNGFTARHDVTPAGSRATSATGASRTLVRSDQTSIPDRSPPSPPDRGSARRAPRAGAPGALAQVGRSQRQQHGERRERSRDGQDHARAAPTTTEAPRKRAGAAARGLAIRPPVRAWAVSCPGRQAFPAGEARQGLPRAAVLNSGKRSPT